MLDSVFSNLCVDYVFGNDTVVLRSPVRPGMTGLQSVKISLVRPEMTYCSQAGDDTSDMSVNYDLSL